MRAGSGGGSTRVVLVALLLCFPITVAAQPPSLQVSGTVLDPTGKPVAGAWVTVDRRGTHLTATGDRAGSFNVVLPAQGVYLFRAEAAGFAPIRRSLNVKSSSPIILHLDRVATAAQQVIVSANVGNIALDSPDPSAKVLVRDEFLDANPARPGAPISLPGLPIETASGGIKAPQYFVPGVAGDHGEPIAQYIAVGDYLVSNNLSANAHGNGYADPNIYVPAAIGSVETDGGAFNVLEGNHSLNLAATYSLDPPVRRYLTVTGDYRDADLAFGIAPASPAKKEWLALEANYGNGLLKRLEHRKQYRWNAMRVFDPGRQKITLLSIGYYATSCEGNLVPVGFGAAIGDTIDPRQRDQTHTSIQAANDVWKVGAHDELATSGVFRTYNLALFSNFGEGLIRQSEFRTTEGGELRESHTFAAWFAAMAGLGYNEDDVHRDDLDHYLSGDPDVYGPFVKVLANDINIRDVTPFVTLRGDFGRHIQLYAGLRHDSIEMVNHDRMKPPDSFDIWRGFENPKATLAWDPGQGPARWLPAASFSIGQSFFTQDPRISFAGAAGDGSSALASPFERSHSEQLVLEKDFHATEARLTLGRTTTTATLAKIDPDDGLAEDEGPGTLKFFTASLGHPFSFGMAQAVFSKADARDDETGLATPEAPRTIIDLLTTVDRLPFGLQGRGEYEYVGHKLLDVGNPDHPARYEAIPVGETRLALVRPFFDSRLELGADSEIARGYTGQTTETFAPGWKIGDPPPMCIPGVDGEAGNFDCGAVERAVGIRMASWVAGSIAWRFGGERRMARR